MTENWAHNPPRAKVILAWCLDRTPWTRLVCELERRIPMVRLFNYHGTPDRQRENFERHVDHLLRRYQAGNPFDLERLLAHGSEGRTSAVFTFDDGLKNNLDVAAHVLESRGIRGIFCIPSDFPDVPLAEQPDWFRRHIRPAPDPNHCEDADMSALSWEDLRELARRGHRICSHSRSHPRISMAMSADVLQAEIVESRKRLEQQLPGTRVDGFCWPVDFDEMALEAERLVRETYAYALCAGSSPLGAGHDPYLVFRTNLEADWSLEVVNLQVSGVVDAKFWVKRWVNSLRTRAGAGAWA